MRYVCVVHIWGVFGAVCMDCLRCECGVWYMVCCICVCMYMVCDVCVVNVWCVYRMYGICVVCVYVCVRCMYI